MLCSFFASFHQQLDLSLNNCDFGAVKIIAESIAYADKILIVGIVYLVSTSTGSAVMMSILSKWEFGRKRVGAKNE